MAVEWRDALAAFLSPEINTQLTTEGRFPDALDEWLRVYMQGFCSPSQKKIAGCFVLFFAQALAFFYFFSSKKKKWEEDDNVGALPGQAEHFRNPDLGRVMQLLADGGRDAFYRGPVAEAIGEWAPSGYSPPPHTHTFALLPSPACVWVWFLGIRWQQVNVVCECVRVGKIFICFSLSAFVLLCIMYKKIKWAHTTLHLISPRTLRLGIKKKSIFEMRKEKYSPLLRFPLRPSLAVFFPRFLFFSFFFSFRLFAPSRKRLIFYSCARSIKK